MASLLNWLLRLRVVGVAGQHNKERWHARDIDMTNPLIGVTFICLCQLLSPDRSSMFSNVKLKYL